MSPQDLQIGQVYFQVSYEDQQFLIPAVDPMLYLGADILDRDPLDESDERPRYVFQDPASFSHYGNAAEYKGDIDLAEDGARIFSLNAEDLDFLFDLKGLVAELSQTLQRAEAQPG
jgi:hypothetical protein